MILSLFFFGQFLNAQSIEPGTWRAKSVFKVSGIPIPSNEEDDCISKDEAKDAKASIAKELKRNGCTLLSWSVKGSAIDASLKCDNDDLEAKGTLKGHFTTKSYDLSGEAEGTYKKMIPSTATLKLTGKWIGICKN